MYQDAEDVKVLETAHDLEDDRANKAIVSGPSENVNDMKEKDAVQFILAKDSEELKSRLSLMDSKLREVRVSRFRLNFSVMVTLISIFFKSIYMLRPVNLILSRCLAKFLELVERI